MTDSEERAWSKVSDLEDEVMRLKAQFSKKDEQIAEAKTVIKDLITFVPEFATAMKSEAVRVLTLLEKKE